MLKGYFDKIDSEIGEYGIVNVVKSISNQIEDPVERQVMEAFIEVATEKLSEEDLNVFENLVLEHLSIEEE